MECIGCGRVYRTRVGQYECEIDHVIQALWDVGEGEQFDHRYLVLPPLSA